MRIAVVSPHLPTPAFPMRGVSHDEQLRLFASAGHAVRAVVPVPALRRRQPPREERDGTIVVAHPRYPRPPRSTGSLGVALERVLFARAALPHLGAPDVVLAHSATLPGALLGRVGGASFVVALYDHEVFELAPRHALLRRAITKTLRGADCAIYISEVLRAHGLALAGPHRTEVIPIGIDTFEGLGAAPPEGFTVSCVTRLVARKKVDGLIRAFARLAVDRPDARLVIVGDGPERPALTALARSLGLADRIELAGALERRAAMARVAHSSVMALPSVLESLGAVYLEAMALGVPALGTAGEGIAAHIESGVDGILVPAGDEDRLYGELASLAADPERARRIGEAGRRRFLAGQLTWRANAEAHLAVFTELRNERARCIA